jgi:hypothetical protein
VGCVYRPISAPGKACIREMSLGLAKGNTSCGVKEFLPSDRYDPRRRALEGSDDDRKRGTAGGYGTED